MPEQDPQSFPITPNAESSVDQDDEKSEFDLRLQAAREAFRLGSDASVEHMLDEPEDHIVRGEN